MAAQETSGWVGTDQGAVHVPEDIGEGFFEGALPPMRGTAFRLILFTGGSCDYEHVRQAGLGAVLLDEAAQTFEAFGALIPSRSARALCRRRAHGAVGGSGGREHVLAQRHVITFVDNDAARFGHIRGSTPSRASAWLLAEHRRNEAELGCFTWFDREPSASTPPDGPSRMQLSFNNDQFH